MKVAEIMSPHVVTVSVATPFRELWKMIFKKHIHALPVVDEKKKLLGIVAEEDLLTPMYPEYSQFIEDFISADDFEEMEEKVHDLTGLTAKDVMCKKVFFTRVDTPIMRALSRMIVRNVRQLPVLSEGDFVVGMVSKGDIFDALFKKYLTLKDLRQHRKISLHHHLTRKKVKKQK